MRKLALALLSCIAAYGQGRPLDWPFYGGDAQRSGWEKTDWRITKDNVKDFQLVLKRKLETQAGPRSLTPPVVIGMLISYRGFKELAFVTGPSDIWSIDADLDRIFWQKHLEGPAGTGACAGVVATPSLTPPINFAARPRPAAGTTTTPAPSRTGSLTAGRGMLGGGGFGAPRPAFALSPDGKLHVLNTSNGDDVLPPMSFIPAQAKASTLAMHDGVIYTTTTGSCGGAQNGVWAIDLSGAEPVVATYPASEIAGLAGVALGTNGTVYAQTGDALVALSPKELKLKSSFATKSSASPLVFAYKGKDMIVSAGKDGSLSLFSEDSLKTPLSKTEPAGGNIWGGLSSWLDSAGARWILAPVWGSSGAIVAYKLEDHDGQLSLTKAWTSRDMTSPEPPVITGGIVFALDAGGKQHATLYALDAATGKEIYSTGDQVASPGNLTGLTLANARVYFTTNDGTLYAFGVFLER